MALEDRVKELEDELKVLKNEIQTTLLDIQEQILSHYYPSLYPSANKEANLAKTSGIDTGAELSQETISQPTPPIVLTSSGYHKKYKTQTVTLVEEADEDEDEENEPFEEEIPPVRLSVVPKPVHKQATPAVNGRSPQLTHPTPEEPAQELTPEDEAFLDAIIASKGAQGANTAVSFDEFKDVIQQKSTDSPDGDLFTEELLDELLKDSNAPFNSKQMNSVTGLLGSMQPEKTQANDTAQINNQAVKLTVRKLLSWVDDSVAIIGKDPTKQAIEMYVRAGDLSTQMRQALLRLVDSSFAKPATEKAGIRQIIDTLGQLNDILDHHTPEYLNRVMGFITEVNFG